MLKLDHILVKSPALLMFGGRVSLFDDRLGLVNTLNNQIEQTTQYVRGIYFRKLNCLPEQCIHYKQRSIVPHQLVKTTLDIHFLLKHIILRSL